MQGSSARSVAPVALWTGLVALRARMAMLRLRSEVGPPLVEPTQTTGGTTVPRGAW